MAVNTENPIKEPNDHSSSEPKRWSAKRKSQVVLRLLRGESIDNVSRDVGLQIYIIEEWRQQALQGIESSLKSRDQDPLSDELAKAMKHIGELSMENELLKERCRRKVPLHKGRLKN